MLRNPYKYMDTSDFNKTKVPTKEEFYSDLKIEILQMLITKKEKKFGKILN